MRVKIIASSSKGNCYVLYGGTGAIMIECGVPFKQIQQAMDFDFGAISGCLITHEHKDHSAAALDIAKAGIDIYASRGTLEAIGIAGHHRSNEFKTRNRVPIGGFFVRPFHVHHDAAEPMGFVITDGDNNESLVFLTDTYYTEYVFRGGFTSIMVECNYCIDILNRNIEAGRIPEPLKNRLLQSHFSLHNVKEMLKANDLSRCHRIVLIHLSDGNSDEERMVREVNELTGITTIAANAGMEIELPKTPF